MAGQGYVSNRFDLIILQFAIWDRQSDVPRPIKTEQNSSNPVLFNFESGGEDVYFFFLATQFFTRSIKHLKVQEKCHEE